LGFPEVELPLMFTQIAQMLASGEFDDLVKQLKEDPVGLIKGIISNLTGKLFSAEGIWRFIILGAQTSPWHLLTQLKPKRL